MIKPDRLPGVGVARENPGREFVVAGPSFRIPRTRVRRPVINQVQLWIVRDPSPNTRATDFPRIRGPTLHAEILSAILGIEWLKFRSDQNIFVGPGAVSPPRDLAGFFIERGEPAANAEFPAAIANQYFSFGDDRSHRDALALVDVPNLCLPDLFSSIGVHGDRLIVERVVKDFAVIVGSPAIHHVATSYAL